MEDVGTIAFSDEEVRALRAYLLKGGFLWVDDYWGELRVGQVGVEQMARVLPPAEYPDRRTCRSTTRSVQVAVRGQGAAADPVDPVLARATRDETSERGDDSAEPHFARHLRPATAT